jgi:hypothetical protein
MSIPRYVHVIAIGVGVIAAVILWLGGALHSTPSMNTLGVLIPPGAVYFFYSRSRATDAGARSDRAGARDRDG